ncbi:MAG: F420-0--gamma-glutamyl ligase [Evtepia sp.]
MEFYANEGKEVAISVGDRAFIRHAIRTRFVNIGDDYIELIREYVLPVYEPGDILSCSEKIIALCQKRVVHEEEVRPGILAKILCRMVHQTAAGPGAGVPYKMQFAINQCGAWHVLWAAFRAGVDKLRGVKGTFYRLTGTEVSGLDGFYGEDVAEYAHLGIRVPDQPDRVCDEIFEKTGVIAMIVDANALGQEILGHASNLKETEATMQGMIKDNPAGQERQLTPFILIRETKQADRNEAPQPLPEEA